MMNSQLSQPRLTFKRCVTVNLRALDKIVMSLVRMFVAGKIFITCIALVSFQTEHITYIEKFEFSQIFMFFLLCLLVTAFFFNSLQRFLESPLMRLNIVDARVDVPKFVSDLILQLLIFIEHFIDLLLDFFISLKHHLLDGFALRTIQSIQLHVSQLRPILDVSIMLAEIFHLLICDTFLQINADIIEVADGDFFGAKVSFLVILGVQVQINCVGATPDSHKLFRRHSARRRCDVLYGRLQFRFQIFSPQNQF